MEEANVATSQSLCHFPCYISPEKMGARRELPLFPSLDGAGQLPKALAKREGLRMGPCTEGRERSCLAGAHPELCLLWSLVRWGLGQSSLSPRDLGRTLVKGKIPFPIRCRPFVPFSLPFQHIPLGTALMGKNTRTRP